ncbi:response regulator [Coraliomargarita sinensis]|uniref:Response regulator n=1 Tax=Coraliomargarita sinensis TaxID=2174842 RepID=A0A317ZIA6_9BACT|nr:response regulator [Coraliomargarita sinensis]PXA03940.1 response regulator [Coraliomargarita sinensis]PXA03943.1 response regulator [Coraliomargarita sinensis]
MSKPIDTACIIDDDETYVFITKRMILAKKLCDQVVIYSNGKVAIDGFRKLLSENGDLPEVILLDINMPVMDGWSFLEKFRELDIPRKITIYMVSSSVDEADMKRAKEYSEVTNYVVKPVKTEDLVKIFKLEYQEA